MFVLSVLEAPNTKTNYLCVQTHLAIMLFLILTVTAKHQNQLLLLKKIMTTGIKKILIFANFQYYVLTSKHFHRSAWFVN